MNKKAVLLVMVLLASMVFISGCTSQTQSTVKSQEDVQKTVTDVSTGVDNVESTLKDIESTIG